MWKESQPSSNRASSYEHSSHVGRGAARSIEISVSIFSSREKFRSYSDENFILEGRRGVSKIFRERMLRPLEKREREKREERREEREEKRMNPKRIQE